MLTRMHEMLTLSKKASVIDLGSNSLKMVNYNINSNSYKPYHQESVNVKLVDGLVDGIITDNYIDKITETLKLFCNIIEFEQIDYVLAVATSTVRDALNKDVLIKEIYDQTGLDFKILSGQEEALYSYTGAINSLNLPTVVFFDIGGGSLEIVYSKNFKIQKILSLPLGSLRLTRQFSTGSNFSESDISNMRSFISEYLPTIDSLGLHESDAVLVGVGGTLRTLAKYQQEITGYPLTKLHNYSMKYESIESISNNLLSKTTQEISSIESMGNGRSYTIQAGSIVISELVKKLGFESLIISAQGLREGTLALSYHYPKDFQNNTIQTEHVQNLLSIHSSTISKYVQNLIELLYSMNLINEKESTLLTHAIEQIDKLSSFRDVDNVLYSILDDDSVLSHREQLIVALSLVYTKKKRKAELLLSKFEKILMQTDRKIIKKISAIISLCDIFHKTKTLVESKSDGNSLLILSVYTSKNTFPEVLFQQICTKMSSTLDITIKYNVHSLNR